MDSDGGGGNVVGPPRSNNRGLSPDREWADSDLESVTSAFSTQSENPNRLR